MKVKLDNSKASADIIQTFILDYSIRIIFDTNNIL